MITHNKHNFEIFIENLAETNATLPYWTDFVKVEENVSKISMRLNQLNFLIGKKNMDEAVQMLWEENPKVFSVLDILIAVRRSQKKKTINEYGKVVLLESYFASVNGVLSFLKGTGLQTFLQSGKVGNLVDYVFGVEVGLDSNARKNRGGDTFADTIAAIFSKHNINFKREVYSDNFSELDILGIDRKRFDFYIKTNHKSFFIEVNFYNSGGSKPSEISRAYTRLSAEVYSAPNCEFVWITDGQGWLKAKNSLEEAYLKIPRLYNLSTIESLLEDIKGDL